MKKSLLLLAVAAVAVSVSASFQKKHDAVKHQAIQTKCASVPFVEKTVEMATPAQRKAAKKVAKKATPKAWYNRPAGSMYVSATSTGGVYYSPMLVSPCWRPVTWPNASENAESYSWSYEKYDSNEKDFLEYNSVEVDLTDSWSLEANSAPTLTATAAGVSDSYHLFSNYTNSTTEETETYDGYAYYLFDPRATFVESKMDCYLSPKFWAAGVREGTTYWGDTPAMLSLGGAKDENGGQTGQWFGKNYGGWNAMGLYVEQPAYSYALRGLHVLYRAEGITGDTELTADVYAATKNEADSVILGDLLYTAKGTLATDAPKYGYIDMPFFAEEDGLEYEVVADINQPIMIVLHGYENAQASVFTMYISGDWCDEGYGQHGYMMAVDDNGTPLVNLGIGDFFVVDFGVTAPSIFLDVEWPTMDWYWSFEDGQYNFPAEGGKLVKTPAEGYSFDYISVFSTKSSQEWTVLTTDDQDIPEWLTLDIADVLDETNEFSNEVQIQATAEALPEDVEYRECDVKFAVPGASIVYHFSQGEKQSIVGDVNGDGVVNVSDVTALVNHIVGAEVYPVAACDINGDGEVNVSDVTALVNLIIG
ncbi:MAG: dockerin type I repeat-containing protein [Sodaliphilus sp.]